MIVSPAKYTPWERNAYQADQDSGQPTSNSRAQEASWPQRVQRTVR